jgi:hypothetical protein
MLMVRAAFEPWPAMSLGQQVGATAPDYTVEVRPL